MSNRVDEVREPAAHRMPQRVEQPPRRHEQDDDHAAGEVHGEHAEQRQHRQRDAVAVPQRGDDQHHGRDGDAVGGQVGHRRGVELDVGDRGERRRQRGRGGRGAGGAPLVGAGAQQMPRQRRGADREQPDRRRHRAQRVGGGRRGAGELAEHRGQRVKRRRVVQRFVGFDVAQLAHVGRRRLAGVEDEANRVGVPDRIPVARDGLPVAASREAPRSPISKAPSRTPAATTSAGPRGRPHGLRRRRRESGRARSANTRATPATSARANSAVHAFHGMPSAPNGTIANATTP